MKKEKRTRISKRCIPGVTLQPRKGYYQVRHIGLTADQVKNDPRFAVTRLMAAWFGQAARWARAINAAIVPGTGIRRMMPRLTAVIRKSVKSGADRQLLLEDIDWSQLSGFECSSDTTGGGAMQLDYQVQWLEKDRKYRICLPAFTPATAICPPEGVTHARIVVLHLVLDTEGCSTVTDRLQTTMIPLKRMTMKASRMYIPFNGKGHVVSILAIGVQWYAKEAGQRSLQRSKTPSVMKIALARTDFWD